MYFVIMHLFVQFLMHFSKVHWYAIHNCWHCCAPAKRMCVFMWAVGMHKILHEFLNHTLSQTITAVKNVPMMMGYRQGGTQVVNI